MEIKDIIKELRESTGMNRKEFWTLCVGRVYRNNILFTFVKIIELTCLSQV